MKSGLLMQLVIMLTLNATTNANTTVRLLLMHYKLKMLTVGQRTKLIKLVPAMCYL